MTGREQGIHSSEPRIEFAQARTTTRRPGVQRRNNEGGRRGQEESASQQQGIDRQQVEASSEDLKDPLEDKVNKHKKTKMLR